jgi:gas vesicle protein
MLEGFLGALVGAVVAAVATMLVAKWQLKLVSENHAQSTEQLRRQHEESTKLVANNHRESLEEQNRIIKETFSQQLLLQAHEKRIQHQIEFLSRLERVVEEDAWSAFLKGHLLRNGGPEGLDVQKALEFAVEVRVFQDEVSKTVRRFDRVLAENAHLEEFSETLRPTLNFQGRFNEPIARLVLTLEGYPQNPSQEIAGFIRDKFHNFSQAVDEYEKWIQICRGSFQSFRTRIYSGEVVK